MCIGGAFMGRSIPTTAFDGTIYNVNTLNICMKEIGLEFFFFLTK